MTLALPKIQKGAAESIRTPDVRLPLHEAGARTAAFKAFGVPIGKAAARYEERENKREMQDAILDVQERDDTFVAQHKGVEEYSIADTDDPHFMELADELGFNDISQPVPGHRVYAEWRARNYKEAVEEAASRISSNDAKRAFLLEHKSAGSTAYMKDAAKANQDQIKYVAGKTMQRVNEAMQNGQFTKARLAVSTSDISSDAKAATNKIIDTQEQTDYFNTILENRDLDLMEGALDQLKQNDPKTTSMLDSQVQKVFANQLRTGIHTIETANNTATTSALKLQSEDATTMIDDIWANKKVDSKEFMSTYITIKDKYPVKAREMEWTMKHQPTISAIMLTPPSAQQQSLQELKDATSGGRETSYVIDQLSAAIAKGQQERGTDSLKWGRAAGVVDYEPIDYTSPESLTDSLIARVNPTISMLDTYGSFTGFLDTEELKEFGTRLENAPDQADFFQSINDGLGEYSESFYEQLKKYGVGGTAPLAGQVASWGEQYIQVSDNILEGARRRKEDKLTQIKMKEMNSELDAFIVSKFQSIFAGNRVQQSINIEGFKDLYAVNGDMEQSFNQLVGGTIDYQGYEIQSPFPGMTGHQYKTYMKNTSPDYWSSPDMKAYNFTPMQLKNSIVNGELVQEGVGRGSSYLKNKNGDYVKGPDGVSNFVFSFDPDEFQRQGAAQQAKEATAKQDWQLKKSEIFQTRQSEGAIPFKSSYLKGLRERRED